MARLAGTTTPPPEPRDKGTPPLSPDLQHRPA
jgi:hypothetical protein